jgi:hypothetical protein
MQFSPTDGAVSQSDHCDSFKFAPATWAVLLSQACRVADGSADCDGFDFGDLADDLERLLKLFVHHDRCEAGKLSLVTFCDAQWTD